VKGERPEGGKILLEHGVLGVSTKKLARPCGLAAHGRA
jgi:hypothetical protein